VTTPAGWYPDPEGSPGQRFWNGDAWTDRDRHRTGTDDRDLGVFDVPKGTDLELIWLRGGPLSDGVAVGL
jgi:hypothetical protein